MTKPITQFIAATSLLWFHAALCVNVYNTSSKHLHLWGPLLAEALLTIPQKTKPSHGSHKDTHTHRHTQTVVLRSVFLPTMCVVFVWGHTCLKLMKTLLHTVFLSLSLPVCVRVCVDVWQALVPGELLSQRIEIEEVSPQEWELCLFMCARECVSVNRYVLTVCRPHLWNIIILLRSGVFTL